MWKVLVPVLDELSGSLDESGKFQNDLVLQGLRETLKMRCDSDSTDLAYSGLI
jgi:hypothetical protein